MFLHVRRLLLGCVALACMCGALPLAAQNLLQNPGFATSIDDGWTPFNGFDQTAVWSNVDINGDSNSGSILGTIPADSIFRTPPYASQCVVIEPNTTYVFGGMAYMPTASTAPGAGSYADAEFFPNTGCFGNNDVYQFAPQEHTFDAWIQVLGVVTSGSTDLSVRVNMYVYAPDGVQMQSYFDNMFLVPDEISRNGFD